MAVLQEILMGCGWEPYHAQCLAPWLAGFLILAVGVWAAGVMYGHRRGQEAAEKGAETVREKIKRGLERAVYDMFILLILGVMFLWMVALAAGAVALIKWSMACLLGAL